MTQHILDWHVQKMFGWRCLLELNVKIIIRYWMHVCMPVNGHTYAVHTSSIGAVFTPERSTGQRQ